MVIFILCFSLPACLVAYGAARLRPWESGRDMINAAWMENSDKLELVARWGIMG